MVREVVHDVLFLGQKSEPATQADKQVAIDLLDTLKDHEEGCVGMAANMIGEAMNFIRGRSFVNTYLIIDEAQNMTPNQVKGIITRAGKGTKIVLLGDPNQIDRPFLDERTNGLSYASEYMKGSPLCYQITMSTEECERSELAMDAIRRL